MGPGASKMRFVLSMTASLAVVWQVLVTPILLPIRLSSQEAMGAPDATPLPTPVTLPARILNIMLLGTDRRPPDPGWRTDSMILVSIDPEDRIVSMVSIPRDLYVAIPGHGKTRLNLADNIGEELHYPGGGPGLLRATLEKNVGITFDYYVRIDFEGFLEVIDSLGGIDVDVACPTELWVPNMKFPDEYLLFRNIPAGMQHMDGELALIYSRCRAHTPVFDRDRRQREVLLAIHNRMLELGLPRLLPSALELLNTMQDHIQTDLPPGEIVALAQLAYQIPPQNITQGTIDLSLAPQSYTAEGSWVMLPEKPSIKEFMASRMVPPTGEEIALADEGARIAIDNGTTIEGFASQMADRLKSRGYAVVDVGKADTLDHTKTTIVSYAGDSFTLESLCQYFGISRDSVAYQPDWSSSVAIRIILGTDAQPQCR